MPKAFKKASLYLSSLLYYLFSASLAYAQTEAWEKQGRNCTDKLRGVEFATLQGFECIFANLLKVIVPLAGLASFVVLIIGGFQYLTSGGDPKQAQKASSIITGAIIGLAVTLGVWFIFRLIKNITGIDLFTFEIPG